MRRLRVRHFRTVFGGIAVLGAMLNAWVLTVHLTSVTLSGMKANGDGVLICRQGGVTTLVDLRGESEKRRPEKRCPICSGFAALQLGVLAEPGLHVALLTAPMAVPSDTTVAPRVVDRRLQRILNRGPPVVM